MGKPSVLVVLTSASEMTGSGKPTGWYLVSPSLHVDHIMYIC